MPTQHRLGRKIVPIEEIVLGIALASAPITAYVFGKAITGVFAWRYAIGGVVGLALLFGLLCFRAFPGERDRCLADYTCREH